MKGSSDTVRDVRGLSVKFFTEEGNHDIVGNHIVSLRSLLVYAATFQAGTLRSRSDEISFPQQKSQATSRHQMFRLDYGECNQTPQLAG